MIYKFRYYFFIATSKINAFLVQFSQEWKHNFVEKYELSLKMKWLHNTS